jgi:predicted MFS family arabinose efflux permease
MFMCATTCSYAFSYFLPIILAGMGYTAGEAQLLSAPPYVVAVILGFSCAIISDKIRLRAPAIAVQAVLCIVGLAITAYAENPRVRYFGTFLGLAGANGNVPAILSYQANNIRMNSRRSVSSALQVGFGAIGGILASTVFRQQDSPRYLNGLWTAMGTQFLLLTLCAVMSLHFSRRNKQQSKGEVVIEGHPDFRYTL